MSRLDHVYDLGSFGEVFTPNEAAATSSEVAPTFAYSSMAKSNANHDPAREPTRERPVLAGFAGRPTHTRGVIFQAAQIEKGVVESPSDYKGRYRVSSVAMAEDKTIRADLLFIAIALAWSTAHGSDRVRSHRSYYVLCHRRPYFCRCAHISLRSKAQRDELQQQQQSLKRIHCDR